MQAQSEIIAKQNEDDVCNLYSYMHHTCSSEICQLVSVSHCSNSEAEGVRTPNHARAKQQRVLAGQQP